MAAPENTDAGTEIETVSTGVSSELVGMAESASNTATQQPLLKKPEPKPEAALSGCFALLLLGALVVGGCYGLNAMLDPYHGMSNDEKVEEAERRGDWETWESTPTEADEAYSRELELRLLLGE